MVCTNHVRAVSWLSLNTSYTIMAQFCVSIGPMFLHHLKQKKEAEAEGRT